MKYLWNGAAVSFAALMAVASNDPVQALEEIRVVSPAAVCFCFLPSTYATDLGIWKKLGLTVTTTALAGEAKVQQAMLSGDTDIGLGGGPGVGMLTKGVPAKSVAAIMYRPAGMALIVPANSPITSLSDLKDKKIGVTTSGSLTDWLARKALESAGGVRLKNQIVPAGDLSSNIAALTSGSTQAMVYGAEAGFGMQMKGIGRVLTTFDKIVPNYVAHVIFATDKFISAKPEAVRAFVGGWLETIKYMRSHRAETIAYAGAKLQLSEEAATLIYDSNMPQFTTDGQFPPAALETLNQSYVELGILPGPVDLSKVIDASFLPK
jgi:ABC-type nitrate/sulfonate/bicarbonate transport system substrate-binding protein